MELKLKYLFIKKNLIRTRVRKLKALINLYTDYIEYSKDTYKEKLEAKIAKFKQKEYTKFQKAYYDYGEEKAIFDVVYERKLSELKKAYRLKFRAYRESTRRKIAKLEKKKADAALIEQLYNSIGLKETELENKVQEIASSWTKEFEAESARRLAKQDSSVSIETLKEELNQRVEVFEADKKAQYELKTQKQVKKFTNKIEKLYAKLDKANSLLEKATNEYTSALPQDEIKAGDLIEEGEVLAVKDLCMYFGGIKAVNMLNFTVKQNEIFGLIGPNGAGKTTVFNCITQFYKPTSGHIAFRNKENEIVDLNKEVVHNVILQGIVRTFQNLEVIKEVSVLDNLLIAAHRSYTSNLFDHMIHSNILRVEESVIRARAIKVLDFMGLLKYKDYLAWGLPYGILKKIEIARTLMCNPQLIILDEPAAGLNDTETVELAALIRKIRDEYNATILLVEHDMGLVMEVCDRICAISFGNLLALGTPEEIQSNKAVQEAYLGVSEE